MTRQRGKKLFFTGRTALILFLAAVSACLPGRRAFAGIPLKTETRSVSLSLDGSLDRNGDSRSDDLRVGTEFECASEFKLGKSALEWDLALYFDYSRSGSDGGATNTRSAGLDLAKILLSRWRGREFETVKPYLLAGAALTWLKEPDPDNAGEKKSATFLSPTAGAGAEFKLSHRASLNIEYRRNFYRGDRRMVGVTLGLSYAIFGGDEEETDKSEKDN